MRRVREKMGRQGAAVERTRQWDAHSLGKSGPDERGTMRYACNRARSSCQVLSETWQGMRVGHGHRTRIRSTCAPSCNDKERRRIPC